MQRKKRAWSTAEDTENESRRKICGSAERVAFTPGEFAASFGRSETWGYRQLYSGRVKAIQLSGRLLIPKAEIDRLLSEAEIYNGSPARAPKARKVPAPTSAITHVPPPCP